MCELLEEAGTSQAMVEETKTKQIRNKLVPWSELEPSTGNSPIISAALFFRALDQQRKGWKAANDIAKQGAQGVLFSCRVQTIKA
jgi:hypothetical protein